MLPVGLSSLSQQHFPLALALGTRKAFILSSVLVWFKSWKKDEEDTCVQPVCQGCECYTAV